MRAIGRALSALDCFTAERPALTLQEISFCIGLAKSTTFRVVHTLEDLGYLIRLADQRYTLSFKLCRLASIAEKTLDVRALARPSLEALFRATGESVTLHTLADDRLACIEAIPGAVPQVQPRPAAPGMGAASLVLMAHLDRDTAARITAAVAHTSDCPSDELRSILDNTRKDGFAVSHGGDVEGITGIAAPVFGPDQEVRFCVGIVVPFARIRGRVAGLARLACATASAISVRLGSVRH